MPSSYASECGVVREVRDRFGGLPRCVDTVLREYELGPLGPLHDCAGFCDCLACCRLAWARNPVYHCPYGKQWGITLTVADTMRQKWWRCRCSPPIDTMPPESKCRCLLLLPTQEYILSPDSSVSMPSEFYDLEDRQWSSPDHVSSENMEALYMIITRLEEEARHRSARNSTPQSSGTVLVDAITKTVHLQHDGSKCSLCRSAGIHLDSNNEYEDTASSEMKPSRRPNNRDQYLSICLLPCGETKPCTERDLLEGP
ncbi:hypothetical protein M758_UG036700 [Ceratodon purpureus]|nr:hypothetical protein M758_UG036700 [Ceratodon purpureus]